MDFSQIYVILFKAIHAKPADVNQFCCNVIKLMTE